jgi:hypothetical protein
MVSLCGFDGSDWRKQLRWRSALKFGRNVQSDTDNGNNAADDSDDSDDEVDDATIQDVELATMPLLS